MDTIKIDKKNVKIVAHRGLSGIELENTCAAFVAAGNRSYFGIETDLYKTKDGKFIVNHNADTAAFSDVNYRIEDTNFDVLRALTLKDKRYGIARADLKMPTLEEYLAVCKHYDKVAVLELKSDFSDAQIAEILAVIEGMNYLESVIFISFNMENLKRIKRVKPSQTVQFLTWECPDTLAAELEKNGMDLDADYHALTEEVVDAMHKHGVKVNCYTCDTAAEAERLIALGVDFITSNILE